MPKKSKISQADINTFLEAVKGVKPLLHDKTRIISTPTSRKKASPKSYQKEALGLKELENVLNVSGDESVSYKQPGVANKTLRKLRKGQYNIEACLDLHGLTIDEAKDAVDRFLQECLHECIHVALIIHGKGLHSQMPILKNKLNHWLRSTNVVLAFCSATSAHGRGGACYVLLRRVRKEGSFG